ncbi:hypothetical protein [Mesorhizobium sp. ORM8.1]
MRDFMAVSANEAVLITADTSSDMVAVQAVMQAVVAAGARPTVLVIPTLPFQGALADPYVPKTVTAAGQNCDVWLDFTWPYLAGSHAYDAAMKTNKVRHLLLGDIGAGGLSRIFGGVDLSSYFEVFHEFYSIIEKSIGKTVRLTNDLGTDVTYLLAKPGIPKPRRCEVPGTYVVPGGVSIFPELESVKGEVAVDYVFHEYYCRPRKPFVLRVDGKIKDFSGGGTDGVVLDRALKRAGGGAYGYVIHFTNGIHPATRMTGTSFIEDIRVPGNNAVGLGLPWWVDGGGENHPDAIITQQSVEIDGQLIVENGKIIASDKLAKMADELKPIWR